MLYTFATNIVACLAALFYPSYACYKLLSRRPCPEIALERWLMYWAVLGALFAVETVISPIISWFPFYHTFRMIFLIGLALNDGQMATFIYAGVLSPFLSENEEFIDSQLAAFRPQVLDIVRDLINKVWQTMTSFAANTEPQMQTAGVAAPRAPPPSMNDPISGPTSYTWDMFRAYAPSAIASIATAMSAPASAAAAPPQTANASSATLLARRAALEAELALLPLPPSPTNNLPPNPQRSGSLTSYFASLPVVGSGPSTSVAAAANIALPPPSRTPYDFAPPTVIPHSSSSASVNTGHSRTPYDSEEERQKGFEKIRREEAEPFVGGFVAAEQSPTRGWWGWGSTPAKAGYERVKSD